MTGIYRAIAEVLVGLLFTHVPALEPYREELLSILVPLLLGLSAWGAIRLAKLNVHVEETSANTKSVWVALNDAADETVVREDGKLGAVTADALKKVIAVEASEARMRLLYLTLELNSSNLFAYFFGQAVLALQSDQNLEKQGYPVLGLRSKQG